MALGCTVQELLQRLDLAEYLDWIAYYGVEPWGEQRADERLAVQLHSTLSPWMPDDSASEPPSLAYPYFEDPEEAAAAIAAAQAEYNRLEAQWCAAVSRETNPDATGRVSAGVS